MKGKHVGFRTMHIVGNYFSSPPHTCAEVRSHVVLVCMFECRINFLEKEMLKEGLTALLFALPGLPSAG